MSRNRAAALILGVTVLAACERGARTEDTTLVPAERVAPPPSAALEASINAEEQRAIAMLPPDSGHAVAVGSCLICHSAAMFEQQRKDIVAWNKTVTQMIAWGAPVTAGQKPILVAYLARHYGPIH
jgi:hypothetical protein